MKSFIQIALVTFVSLGVCVAAETVAQSPPTTPTFNATALLCKLNRYRIQRRLDPFGLDARLVKASQLHSNDQAYQQRMTHEGSDGSSFGDRATRAGYKWKHIAENVGTMSVRMVNEEEVLKLWMRGGGATDNMLSNEDMAFGAGGAVGKDGYMYFTAVMGKEFGQKGPTNVPRC